MPGGVDVDVAAGGARVDRHVEVERHPALVGGCTVYNPMAGPMVPLW